MHMLGVVCSGVYVRTYVGHMQLRQAYTHDSTAYYVYVLYVCAAMECCCA